MYSSKSKRHRSKQMNRKTPARRWLAFLLTICMLIPLSAPIDTLAEESNNTSTLTECVNSDQTIASDIQTILPNDTEVETFTEALWPSIISQEEVQQNQYIGRVRAEEENLNTLVFKNADGTNTMRIFNHPVKYVDTDGTVKDISLKLETTSNGYQPAAHNIATTFANQLSDGIRMRYEDIDLLLTPVMQSSSSATQTAPMALASLSTNCETVSYPFGVNTTLEYTLTYTGYKEDIVVSQYTGQTEYNFLLQTGGLIPEMDAEGGWILNDSDGNPRASLGDIIIFTADERNNTLGRLTVETIKANQIYLLTIHVDSDWLSDPDTVYPIRIDPAMDVINTSDGSNAIEDLTLNSNAGSSMTSKSLSVGKRESYGISRILMRFPGLDLSRYNSADQIISVTVGLRDILCESTPLDVYCHAYNEAWVSSPSWTTQNPNNYDSTVLSQKSVSYAAGLAQPTAHRYQFDITAAVKNWKNNPATKEYGILFKASTDVENSTTYNAKTMASFNRTSNQPNLTVNYQPVVILYPTEASILVGETIQLITQIIPNDNESIVTFVSSAPNIATVSEDGLVKGIATGSASIAAYISEEIYYVCEITVSVPIQNVSINCNDVRIAVNEVSDIVAYTSPTASSTRPVTWTSSDPSVATITGGRTATVTGVSSGCAIITVTGDGHSASIIVYVGNQPKFESKTPYLIYYYRNSKYMRRTGASLYTGSFSGLDNVNYHWYLTCIDNSSTEYYLVSSGYRNGEYLYITDSNELSWKGLNNNLLAAPDSYQWEYTALGFKNKATGHYLHSISNTNTIILGTTAELKGKFRYIRVADFVELSNFSITNLTLPLEGISDIHARINPSPSGATWSTLDDFTYSFDNTSIAYQIGTGNAKALSAGSTTVTVTHNPTGISTTFNIRCINKVVLEKEDTDTQVGELFFTIGNASRSKFLRASDSYDRDVACVSSDQPKKDGQFIWRLKQDTNGYYQFISVSNYRTVNDMYSEACLESSTSVSTEAVGTSNSKQQWVIEKTSGGYHIINHYNNQYLTIDGSALTVSSSPSSDSIWTIEGIPADQFESYFSGDITRGWNEEYSILHVWINVDDSLISCFSGITPNDIRNWAAEWDGLGGIVSIHTGTTAPDSCYQIKVSARSFYAVDSDYALYNVIGVAIPNGDNALPRVEDYENINTTMDYTHSHIFLNTDTASILEENNADITLKDCLRLTFLHEMGHALKLAHPSDKGVYNIRSSIMTSQFPQTDSAQSITDYDLMNLLCKWKYGGCNNIESIAEDCTLNTDEVVELPLPSCAENNHYKPILFE